MFSSQYFTFPLSVPFHHRSIPIFNNKPHYIMYSSQYFSFHLSVQLHLCSIPIFTFHPHSILFSSQYFSFPLSVTFYHCSIHIHSPTTHTILYIHPSTSVSPCKYHSTIAPYTFIHLPPTIYNVSLPVFQFPHVSTIPPLLHTHSFTYHPHYIIISSQYFSFPLSVPFDHCSIHIHSTTYHTI